MNPQSICELIGLLAVIVALALFLRGRRRARLTGSKRILGIALCTSLMNYFINFVEWSEAPINFDADAVEDTLDLLTPVVWWFFLYSCCQHVVAKRLHETIAARQEMEKAVRSSETYLRTVLENVPVFICRIDPSGKILWANQDFHGVSAKTAMGMPLPALLPDRSNAAIDRAIEQVFLTGEHWPFEIVEFAAVSADIPMAWFSCRLVPVHVDGDIISAIFVATDVTNLKKAEQELRHSEQRFRTLVEHAPEAIVVVDIDAENFVDANQKAGELLEFDNAALLDMGWLDVSPPLQPDNRASAASYQNLVEKALDGELVTARWTFKKASQALVECDVRLVRQPSLQQRLVRGSIIPSTT